MLKRPLTLVAFAAGALLVGAPAEAQAQAAETPDREELVTFAEAFVEIAEVRNEVTPRIAAAETQEEAASAQAEANERMLEVLEEHELAPQRYNAITQQINQDAELLEEFEEILAEIEGGVF